MAVNSNLNATGQTTATNAADQADNLQPPQGQVTADVPQLVVTNVQTPTGGEAPLTVTNASEDGVTTTVTTTSRTVVSALIGDGQAQRSETTPDSEQGAADGEQVPRLEFDPASDTTSELGLGDFDSMSLGLSDFDAVPRRSTTPTYHPTRPESAFLSSRMGTPLPSESALDPETGFNIRITSHSGAEPTTGSLLSDLSSIATLTRAVRMATLRDELSAEALNFAQQLRHDFVESATALHANFRDSLAPSLNAAQEQAQRIAQEEAEAQSFIEGQIQEASDRAAEEIRQYQTSIIDPIMPKEQAQALLAQANAEGLSSRQRLAMLRKLPLTIREQNLVQTASALRDRLAALPGAMSANLSHSLNERVSLHRSESARAESILDRRMLINGFESDLEDISANIGNLETRHQVGQSAASLNARLSEINNSARRQAVATSLAHVLHETSEPSLVNATQSMQSELISGLSQRAAILGMAFTNPAITVEPFVLRAHFLSRLVTTPGMRQELIDGVRRSVWIKTDQVKKALPSLAEPVRVLVNGILANLSRTEREANARHRAHLGQVLTDAQHVQYQQSISNILVCLQQLLEILAEAQISDSTLTALFAATSRRGPKPDPDSGATGYVIPSLTRQEDRLLSVSLTSPVRSHTPSTSTASLQTVGAAGSSTVPVTEREGEIRRPLVSPTSHRLSVRTTTLITKPLPLLTPSSLSTRMQTTVTTRSIVPETEPVPPRSEGGSVLGAAIGRSVVPGSNKKRKPSKRVPSAKPVTTPSTPRPSVMSSSSRLSFARPVPKPSTSITGLSLNFTSPNGKDTSDSEG